MPSRIVVALLAALIVWGAISTGWVRSFYHELTGAPGKPSSRLDLRPKPPPRPPEPGSAAAAEQAAATAAFEAKRVRPLVRLMEPSIDGDRATVVVSDGPRLCIVRLRRDAGGSAAANALGWLLEQIQCRHSAGQTAA